LGLKGLRINEVLVFLPVFAPRKPAVITRCLLNYDRCFHLSMAMSQKA